MSAEEYKASLKEKIPYGMYFFGQGMIYTLVSQYLMMYYTDYAYLPTLVISEKSGMVSTIRCLG